MIKKNCDIYRESRDAMINAAKQYLPPEIKFNVPGSGMFIWFELPEKYDTEKMVWENAEDLKVLLVPGNAFSSADRLKNYMRASFSMAPPDKIDEGIKRFAEMIKRASV